MRLLALDLGPAMRGEKRQTALVEAMAAGCLTVGHDVGGSSEMVQGGTAGALVAGRGP